MHRRGAALAVIVAMAIGALPVAAHANSGVGYLLISIPILVVTLPAAILIEAPILAHWLKVPFRRALWISFAANLFSTLLGALIAIAFDLALTLGQSSGLPGVALSALIALVPMFFITLWLERMAVRRLQPQAEAPAVKRGSLVANLVTYALLAVVVAVALPWEDPLLIRSQLTEVVLIMGMEKTEVAEAFDATGRFPTQLETIPRSKYLRSMRLEDNGRIVAVLAMPGRADVDGKTLAMQPRVEGRRIVEWRCYTPDLPLRVLPANCRQRQP